MRSEAAVEGETSRNKTRVSLDTKQSQGSWSTDNSCCVALVLSLLLDLFKFTFSSKPTLITMYTESQIQCALLMASEISLSKLSEDFGEQSDPTGEKSQKTWLTISEALAITLKQAICQHRLTMGVYECATLLSSSPNRAMLCVLPEITTGDVAMHIHHTLIKSFCWEHDIRFLTVKDEQSLLDLVKGCPEYSDTTPQTVSCLLVEYPMDGNSEADTFVCGYHDAVMLSDIFPKPVIHLPD